MIFILRNTFDKKHDSLTVVIDRVDLNKYLWMIYVQSNVLLQQ